MIKRKNRIDSDWDEGGRINGGPNNDRTNGKGSSRPNSSSNSGFYGALTKRLRNLSFSAFQTGVLLWLGAKGFRDIRALKRTAARGRRQIGGADFIGGFPHDPDVNVAIQVRHWQTPVQRRAIDELWGFMLRQGIPQGLIVTNSVFSPKAMTAALEFSGRPIKLVSVAQLAGSMAALGLGVEPTAKGRVVSEAFFRTLDQLRLASNLATDLEPARIGRFGNRSVGLDSISANPPSQPEDPQSLWWLLIVVLALSLLALALGGRR